MKKNFAILFVLLAIAFRGFAQDTIIGVVNRVSAPYFEQNVCDTRFALSAGDETYYVMVDNYWPNPYIEELVIHYDTIPVGNEIEVVGEILEMEDGNGDVFKTIDISKNLNSRYCQIFGFFYYDDIAYYGPVPVSAAEFFKYSATDHYFITFNGELVTETPFVVNGRVLEVDKRYMFIGSAGIWTDYNGDSFNVFELKDALPYDIEDVSISGTLTTDNDLCLSWPRGDAPYLSIFDGKEYRYLMNKRKLQNDYTNYYIRNAFDEGMTVVVGGFETIHYDLFGIHFKALEAIKIQTDDEKTLSGQLTCAAMPYISIGPPVPGVNRAFYSQGAYYIDNPWVWDSQNLMYFNNAFIVGNDTIYYEPGQKVTLTFIPRMILNNYRNSVFYIVITEINDFDGVQEKNSAEVQVFPNPADNDICISSKDYIITHINIMDSKGCLLISKPYKDNNIQFSNLGIHGLLFFKIELSDNKVVSKKIIVK